MPTRPPSPYAALGRLLGAIGYGIVLAMSALAAITGVVALINYVPPLGFYIALAAGAIVGLASYFATRLDARDNDYDHDPATLELVDEYHPGPPDPNVPWPTHDPFTARRRPPENGGESVE